MCGEVGETVDLIGVSVNSQCNECRSVNAANIKACSEGRAGGPEVATTAVYRLVCNRYDEDTEGCNSYSCLDPGDVKGPYDHVVGTYHEWEACYKKSSMYTGFRRY